MRFSGVALLSALCAVVLLSPVTAAQPASISASGPQVAAVALHPAHPQLGQAATLAVTVRDPVRAILGVTVDLGEPGGEIGASACELGKPPQGSPFVPGTAITIRIPITFRVAGSHRVAFEVRSGDCRASRSFIGSLTVDIPAATVPSAAEPAAAGQCAGADVAISSSDVASARRATLCLVNANRHARGLRPLVASRKLTSSASFQSRDMVARRYFAHQRRGGPSFEKRLERVHYTGTAAGEDIGYEGESSDETARHMVKAWMQSPPHRANILRRLFRIAGVGVVPDTPNPSQPGSTFTIDFGH